MRRALALAAVTGAILASAAWPAAAKGGPAGATISGPGLGGAGGSRPGGTNGAGATAVGTIVLRDPHGLEPSSENDDLWQLASFSGLFTTCGACSSYIDTSPPTDRKALGPVYRITYFTGRCCDQSVRQFLYPFAPGGPVTYTTADVAGDDFLSSHRTGWWHADGRMGVLFLKLLHDIGVPATNPLVAAPVAGGSAVEAAETTSTTWRLLLAAAVLALVLLVGAVAARPKSPARPA